MYDIYLDMIIIENLLINYVILHITTMILRTPYKWYRLLLSSACGCIYCVLSIYISHLLTTLILQLILSIVMVLLAFPYKSIRQYLEQCFVFYIVTFSFAGITLVFFNTNKKYYIFLLSAVGYLFYILIMKIIGHQTQKKLLYKLYIKMENREVFLTAYMDTGNMLKDPFSNQGAIIAEATVLEPIIPTEIFQCLTENTEEKIADISPYWASRFLVLPFSSIGEKSGNLKAFRCDYAVITSDSKDTYIVKNAIIAIYFSSLSYTNIYSALLPPDILYNRR